jgi:DNA-binding transcriptional LysR family regulator
MKIDLAALKAFLAVADLGSFVSASHALHLSQSALSRRIDKLESALGVRLFDRTTRRVELTTFGRGFVPRARNVLNELESALLGMEYVAERLSGEVTIACVPSAVAYFLPGVIRPFHERYPRIRLRIKDESSSEVLTTVERGEADFGITYIGTQDADISFFPLITEHFVVAMRRDHEWATRKTLSWADLSACDYISLAQGSGNRFLIDQALAQHTERPRWYCEVQHVTALVSLVEAGLGVGVVPQLAMPPDNHPALVSVPLLDPEVTRVLGLIVRRGRQMSPAADLLFGMLLEKKRDRGAASEFGMSHQ